jgi:hypothetical protein
MKIFFEANNKEFGSQVIKDGETYDYYKKADMYVHRDYIDSADKIDFDEFGSDSDPYFYKHGGDTKGKEFFEKQSSLPL